MDFDWRQRRTIRILSFILVVLVVAVLIVGGYRWRQLRQVQQDTPGGEGAAMIGEVDTRFAGRVTLENAYGANRILTKLTGAQLPRIC